MEFKQYSIIDITDPRAGRIVMKNSYWCCINGDPKQALFYGTSPQCNRNKAVIESITKQLHEAEDNIKVIFVETAFVIPR